MSYKTFTLSLLFSIVCFFSFSLPAFSQVNNPSLWSSFVNDSKKNIPVPDTILFQSFEGTMDENWEYKNEGGVIGDVSIDGIEGQGGIFSLKLRDGASVTFDLPPASIYTDYVTYAIYAAHNTTVNSTLEFDLLRNNGKKETHTMMIGEADLSFSYGVKKGEINNPIKYANLSMITIKASIPSGDGYLCIDSVYLRGRIPDYSLFTGTGNWQDTVRWSHLPPLRRRNALIRGDVKVDSSVKCNDVAISEGSLHIADGKRLELNNLTLHDTDVSFTSKGTVSINGITVYKTFGLTDEWYFISFPFDVYEKGIDSNFTLKDDKPNSGGNYFYVLTYNGEKRQTSNNPAGNWEVLSPSRIGNGPVFEKNKGYLIALDKKATTKTIHFSSSEAIPADFGKAGRISVPVSSSGNNENSGWYLCGNPYAAPLSLSQFPKSSNLDGYVYVYDGSSYQAYEIGSNYTLPPFSAFFVKAKKNTNLSFTKALGNESEIPLSVSSPVRLASEPKPVDSPMSQTVINKTESHISGNILSLKNLTEAARLSVYNINGRVVLQMPLAPGSSKTALPLPNGFYILQINSPHYQSQHKCIINQ